MFDLECILLGAASIAIVYAIGFCVYHHMEQRHINRIEQDRRDLSRIDML